ncbi:MAG: undecaprenyl-phosphate glucose phosphotransferase [Chitinophagaceae bacterium]
MVFLDNFDNPTLKDRNSQLSSFTLKFSDFFIVNASFFFAPVWVYVIEKQWIKVSIPDVVVYNVLWLFFSSIFHLYSKRILKGAVTVLRQTYKSSFCHFVVFGLYMLYVAHFETNYRLYSWFLAACAVNLLVLLTISRFYLTYLIEFVASTAKLNRKCAILGENQLGATLADFFNDNQHLYTFVKFLDKEYALIKGENGELSSANANRFIEDVSESNIDDIYAALPISPSLNKLFAAAENNCVKMHFVDRIERGNRTLQFIEEEVIFDKGLHILNLRSEPLSSLRNRIKKRLFDLAFSTFVIVFILSWLYPIIAIIIKLGSKGPVIFKQQRSGKDNKPFNCYKFRSMRMSTDADTKQATKNDARLTKFGAFMRKTSLDELPQFFNVWKGEMSIVGPRPHMLKHTEQYQELIEKYLVRQFLKPGITGWAQVNGFRGETKELSLMQKRVEYDIWYMENWSLMLDVRIVFMTVINIIKGEPEAY